MVAFLHVHITHQNHFIASNFFKVRVWKVVQQKTAGRSFENENMSRKNGNGAKLDLKLNLSPPRRNTQVPTPSRSATVSSATPLSSCVSSEPDQEDIGNLPHSSSPEATSSSMVLAGCPRCLMYIMLSEEDPRCPKCESTVLLDVLQDHNSSTTTKSARNK